MQLYIDANVYLEYFRENSSERLSPLRELVRLIDAKKIELLLPTQTKQEYFRNRRRIAEVTRASLIKQGKISSLIPAVMDGDAKEVKSVLKNTKALGQAYRKLIAKYDEDVEKEKTDADLLLNKLFSKATILEDSEEIVHRAYRRYMKGNPPRKSDHSYGDAITWEILLEQASNDDLVVITKDGDYMEIKKGEQALNGYLYVEWRIKTKKKKSLRLYKSLAEFVNTFEKKQTIKKEIVQKEKGDGGLTHMFRTFGGEFVPASSVMSISPSATIGNYFSPTTTTGTWTGTTADSLTIGTVGGSGFTSYYGSGTQAAAFCPYCGHKVETRLFDSNYLCANPRCGKQFRL